MPTQKRQRQKDNQRARQQAILAAQRRVKARNRVIIIVIVVGVLAALIAALSAGGNKSKKTETSTPTTAAKAAAFTYGTGACPKVDGSSPKTLKFSTAPKRCIDPAKTYTATFDTTEGTVKVALDTKKTPGTVNNFAVLSRYHYYDGSRIFRTDTSIDIIQGGGPTTNSPSDPGPGYTIPDEGKGFKYAAGDLVMARSQGPNSASAQYFFVAGPKASVLNGQGTYVTFGKVTLGLDVVQKILGLNKNDPTSQLGGAPSRPVTVTKITITES